jgi:hypothetical protein
MNQAIASSGHRFRAGRARGRENIRTRILQRRRRRGRRMHNSNRLISLVRFRRPFRYSPLDHSNSACRSSKRLFLTPGGRWQ